MAYSWTAVALRDGQIIAPLPDLTCETVGVRICNYQTATASLPVGGTGKNTPPADWQRATTEGATVYVLTDDLDDGVGSVPVWGGYITSATPSTGDTIPLSLSTLEAYLDARYVGDVTYTATDQNAIISDLIARFVNDGTITIRVQIVGGPGKARDRTYKDASNKSVLAALTELSAVIGGPEWTIGWEWQHTPERITPVLYVGTRLGAAVTPGLMPNAVFEAPGSIITAALTRDYTAGKGANRVIASSSASATDQPQSPPQVYSDPLRPTFEYRFTPSTSISDVNTLTAHAQAALAQMQQGSRSLTMTAAVESAPRLGRDWSLGDDIGYQIGDPGGEGAVARTNLCTNPSFEAGTTGWVAWSVNATTTTAWKASGAQALALQPSGVSTDSYVAPGGDYGAIRLGMLPGHTYTASATVNTPVAQTGTPYPLRARAIAAYTRSPTVAGGAYVEKDSPQGPVTGSDRVSVTFTIPADATEAFIRLYNGADNSSANIVMWDAVLLEESSTLNPYGDGSTIAPDGYRWKWTGAPNASTSVLVPVIPDSVPAFPGGISGTARALGWDLTINGVQTVTPILGGV